MAGMTPLACAVSKGKAIAVRYFLDKGADPNKQDNIGFTPLHYATKEGVLLHMLAFIFAVLVPICRCMKEMNYKCIHIIYHISVIFLSGYHP